MSRRWLVNLALALVLGALAVIAVYKPGLEQPAEHPALTALTPQAVARIEILRSKEEPIVLERTGEDWRLVAPFAARANRFRIDKLLRVTAAESELHRPAGGEQPARYGLDPPQAILRLDGEEIRFGGLHPLKPLQYVLYRETIHLIPAGHFHAVAAAFDDFLSTSLLDEGAEPQAFYLPGLALELADGAWRLRPANPDIATDRLHRFVHEWKHARALRVSRDRADPFPKGAPERITIRLAPGANAPPPGRALEIGIRARAPELVLYRADEGLQYHFPQDAAERLLRLPPE